MLLEVQLDLFLNFLLAILSGLAVYGIYGLLKRPKIEVKPTWQLENMQKEPAIQTFNGDKRVFYHISVINKGKFSNPARNVRAKLTFYKTNERRLERLFSLPAKWDFRPEPIRFQVVGGADTLDKRVLVTILEPSLLPQAEVIDVNPKAEETFCILLKYDGEDKAYAFNAFSYMYGEQRNPNWELRKGVYHIKVEIIGENVHTTSWIEIEVKGGGLEIGKDVIIKRLDCKNDWSN